MATERVQAPVGPARAVARPPGAYFAPVMGEVGSVARVVPDSPLPERQGWLALARGDEIHLSPAVRALPSDRADHILWHELTHVEQQARGLAGANMSAGERAGLEVAAERAARSSGPIARGPLPAAPSPVAQGFDPEYHEQAVIGGLRDSGLSAQAIGSIYGANWERDFSQAHPNIGALVLAWKTLKGVKVGTAEEVPAIQGVGAALEQLVRTPLNDLINGAAYGGYQEPEHMDSRASALLRRSTDPPGVSGWITRSRDHIKDCLDRAFDGSALAVGSTGPTSVESAAALAAETHAVEQGAVGGFTPSQESTYWMGRASHALEDFFAHSNFVEIAIFEQAADAELVTGTFGNADKIHSLLGKLRHVWDELKAFIESRNTQPGMAILEKDLEAIEKLVSPAKPLADLTELYAKSQSGTHSKLAKDHPEPGAGEREKMKFDLAFALATEANMRVFNPLINALQFRDHGNLVVAKGVLDSLIARPIESHPLWSDANLKAKRDAMRQTSRPISTDTTGGARGSGPSPTPTAPDGAGGAHG